MKVTTKHSKRKTKIFSLILTLSMIFTMLLGSIVFADDVSEEDPTDLSSIIESVEFKMNGNDLFKDNVLGENHSGTLLIKLKYDDSNGIKINEGDTLSIMLEPESEDKDFFIADYSASNELRYLMDGDIKVADLTFPSRKGIEFKFTNFNNLEHVSRSFEASIEIPFAVDSFNSCLDNWFEKEENKDKSYVDFSYKLKINGQDADKTAKFRLNKPMTTPPKTDRMIKTRGTYNQQGELGQGYMLYNLRISTLLNSLNEYIIYDAPDVNLGFDGYLKVNDAKKSDSFDRNIFTSTPESKNHYAKDSETGTEIWLYDVYYITKKSNDLSVPRQAGWIEETIDLNRESQGEKIFSTEKAAIPENILFEIPTGTDLNDIQKKEIEDAGGLHKAVGKGFKVRIKNFNSKFHDLGGYITFQNRMGVKGNSPMLSEQGMPIYLNSASYYAQEIPSCGPENDFCPPILIEGNKVSDIANPYTQLTTKAEVTSGNVNTIVSEHSKLYFNKTDKNGKPLEGAVFTIYTIDSEGNKVVAKNKDDVSMENLITNSKGELCTKDNGSLTPVNTYFKRGNYIWEEIAPPKKYLKSEADESERTFTIGLLKNEVTVINEEAPIPEEITNPKEPTEPEIITSTVKPQDPPKPTAPSAKKEKSTSPKTNDSNNSIAYGGALILALLGIFALTKYKQRKNNNL